MKGNPMQDHKFKVGQTVRLVQGAVIGPCQAHLDGQFPGAGRPVFHVTVARS